METEAAVKALAALAQDTRLGAFRLLVQQGPSGLAAGEIAAQLDIAPATLSFHLKELSHAGLVTNRQDGRYIYYSANFDAMTDLLLFLTENCCVADGRACTPGERCTPSGRVAARPAAKSRAPTKTRKKVNA